MAEKDYDGDWAKFVIETREMAGESQGSFAEKIGVSQQTVSLWEQGNPPRRSTRVAVEMFRRNIERRSPIPRENAEAVAMVVRDAILASQERRYARVRKNTQPAPTAMIDAEAARGNVKSRQVNPDGTETAFYHELPLNMVPLVSWVQAGCFVDPCAQTTPGYAEEFAFYPGRVKPHMFALKVHNDSMEPEFREGDIVVVDPDRPVDNGAFVIAKNGAHEATLKKFVRDGGKVYLRPLNRDYDPIEVTEGDGIRIVGVVVFKGKVY